ncbi:hypothetical protein JCM1840_001293 [Sporobolomyces johnsonii]
MSPRRPPSPARSSTPTLYRPPHHRQPMYTSSSAALPPPPSTTRPSPSPASQRTPSRSSGGGGGGLPLEVHGDSFASVFTLLKSRARVNKYKGASARGLNNPASSLQVGEELLRRVGVTRPRSLLLMFGHVDLHINYLWKARDHDALRPSEWVHRVVSDYSTYLSSKIIPLAESTGMRVYIAGVTMPVVGDHYLEFSARKYIEKEGVGPLSPLSRATQPHDLRTRRAMVKLHNQLLSQFCAHHPALVFVDINKYLVSSSDPEKVSQAYVDREDPTNIHLIWERTIHFWCREIDCLRDASPAKQDEARFERTLEAYRTEKRERMRRNSITSGLAAT